MDAVLDQAGSGASDATAAENEPKRPLHSRPRFTKPKTRTLRRRIKLTLHALARARSLPLRLGVLAAFLASPALFIGYNLDDHVHRYFGLMLPGYRTLCPSYLSFFSIASGDPEKNHELVEQGFAPYWTLDRLRLSFFRPLTALTHRLDYWLWPDSSVLMHAQSIAWFAACIYVATLFYRRVLSRGSVSGLAAFFFAVDHVHGLPIGWLANRNALVAAFFGTAALVLHDASRHGTSRSARYLGPLALALAFAGGESALGAWGFLIAHALVLDRDRPGSRLAALAPYALVTGAWRAVYDTLGYGAFGSGLYVDPMSEPLAFGTGLLTRIPLCVLGLFGFPPAEAHVFVAPHLTFIVTGGALLLTAALAVTVYPAWKASSPIRYFSVASVLALVPACTALPHNRLLYFGSLGAMGLLSVLFRDAIVNASWWPASRSWQRVARVTVAATAGLHFFFSPLLLPLAACNILVTRFIVSTAIPSAMAAMTANGAKSSELLVLNAPDYFFVSLLRIHQRLVSGPEPERLRMLSVGAVPLRLVRLDARRLRIEYEGGLLANPLTRLYRDERFPIREGHTVRLEGMDIEVTKVTDDGRPLAATITLSENAGSPRYAWVAWHRDRYERISPPDVGKSIQIAPARLPFEFGDD